jgi:hypothetical protein
LCRFDLAILVKPIQRARKGQNKVVSDPNYVQKQAISHQLEKHHIICSNEQIGL